MKSSDVWYTPEWILNAARQHLGDRIDFDPASDATANWRVGAKRYLEKDSLEKNWPAVKTIFMNPPFSKAKQFYSKLSAHYHAGDVDRFFAVLPGNINSTYLHEAMYHFHVFAPEGRVAFIDPDTGVPATSPRGNVVLVLDTRIYIDFKGRWIS